MGSYYGYNGGGNQVSFFKPILVGLFKPRLRKNGEHLLETKNGNTSLSCSGSCKVIKIKYANGASYNGLGFPVYTYGEKYILRNDSSIDGMAMSDLIGGCMNSTLINEVKNQKLKRGLEKQRYLYEKEKNEEIKEKKHTQHLLGVFASEIINKVNKQVGSIPKKHHNCTIEIKLNRLGQVVGNPKIIKSCGGDQENKNAIDTIENAAPFPIPAGIPFYLVKTVNVYYPFW
jgi:hypothetical protein